MSIRVFAISLLPLAAFAAVGCSDHSTVPEFGETVRNVMESQIHDHEAAIHPKPEAVEGSDGYRLDNALEAHRNDVARPEQIQQPVTISVGN